MDVSMIMPIIIGIAVVVGGLFVLALLFNAFYKKVPQGFALIKNDMSAKPKVYFTGAFVVPVVHKMEIMKISLITLEVDRRGKDGLICKDNLRADITVAFYLRVNETQEDVLKVAKAISVDRASDRAAVNELFNAKFSEALKTVGKQLQFLDLFENRIMFREKIVEVIGDDLNGYVLEDVAIDYLEQTPRSQLDPNNILDSEGIRRITEITATQNVETNRLERDEELAIKKKNVETKEATLSLERQQADAEARQKREIETIQAREQAETDKVRQEELLRSEQARLQTEEQVAVGEENKNRQIEVAEQNRLRAIEIEKEKVIKARELEIVHRQREVELEEINKEKALEEERKIIANTISERIAVERKVAEEEERIKEVREVSEADRAKQVQIMDAEAKAQEELIRQVKAAEADEQRAVFKAKEINLMAQADLEAAAKQAEAMKKKAEGDQAEQAAPGLAKAQVLEITAAAREKEGLAEAKIIEAKAGAKEKDGLAEAKVLEEKMRAEAIGVKEKGLSEAATIQAKGDSEAHAEKAKGLAVADAKAAQGKAEAEVLLAKAKAEADGLMEKFSAMNNMSPDSREFEEFRMKLEYGLQEMLASLDANKDVAKEQAAVIAAALENSNIDIVGGQGEYFDKLSKGLGLGNALNGFLEKSPIADILVNRFLGGDDKAKDSKEVN
jgi:uncharacterized membrane protein YqiK